MSKKYFIALGDTVQYILASVPLQNYQREMILNKLADFCSAQNPNFKRSRWIDYVMGKCGPNGGRR